MHLLERRYYACHKVCFWARVLKLLLSSEAASNGWLRTRVAISCQSRSKKLECICFRVLAAYLFDTDCTTRHGQLALAVRLQGVAIGLSCALIYLVLYISEFA